MTIKINLKIFIFIVFFYFTKQINIYYTIMIFAILHELGHLVAGMILGLKPTKLTLMPYGLSINFVSERDGVKTDTSISIVSVLTPSLSDTKREVIVSMAGPMINILIILICLIFEIKSELIIYSNIVLLLLNLIPIYPLDGGRIFKSILYLKYGIQKAEMYTNTVMNIIMVVLSLSGIIIIILTKNIAIFFVLIYLWTIIIIENKRYKFKIKFYKVLHNIT